MGTAVPIVMFGWLPIVVVLFAVLPSRRALVFAYVFAWLFLPVAAYEVIGLPDYTKMSATSLGSLLGVLLFDRPALARIRPGWLDVPMGLFLVSPFFASVSNGLGLYDGASETFTRIIEWGIPYALGRAYFRQPEHLRDLAMGIVIGGVLYIPLCLVEVRLSPQLHNWVYGFHPNKFGQTMRMGGFRPTVFMQHGLMVAMWMVNCTLLAFWAWWRGSSGLLGRLPLGPVVGALFVTSVLCKSVGALFLGVLGFGMLYLLGALRNRLPILAAIVVIPLFLVLRVADPEFGTGLPELFSGLDERAAESLTFRMDNELLLIEKAMERPLFGWGGWGRSRVYNEFGTSITTADGLWVQVLGTTGLVGLFSWLAAFLLPLWVLARRGRRAIWLERLGRSGPLDLSDPAWALIVIVLLYVADCIPNSMENPLFTITIGALTAVAASRTLTRSDRHEVERPRTAALDTGPNWI